ncbi:MAG: PEP-CTERM sorting domain-containing protein [Alphaproteobacteria bacterium]|nr:PEP-CTERM sorting domain-containing protein [Alphaproteobacteria bacterium]
MKRFALLAAVVGLLSSYATPSLAATVDYIDMGSKIVEMGSTLSPLTAGYEGIVATGAKQNAGNGYALFDSAKVYLAGKTSILFTYTLTETPTVWGTFTSPNDDSGNSRKYEIDTYTLTSNANQFFISIANLTDDVLDFKTALKLKGITNIAAVGTTYSTSPVPLPAALPLFGLGLVGLAGYRRMKKGSVEA